jgi:2-oxoglutarate ferredoxin oxidoreductase subunit alpha
MRFNVLIGGQAGQGPNLITQLLGKVLVTKGFYVFYSRDYQSLIRGGHNFNVLTFSKEPVHSNDSEIDLMVALDKETVKLHKNKLKKKSAVLSGEGTNMFFAGKLFKTLSLEFELLEIELKQLGKRFEENLKEAKEGYEKTDQIFDMGTVDNKISESLDRFFRNGSKAVSEGAIKAGLDIYYAYPMTPATGVMTELAEDQVEKNHLVIELENEIAVANAGVGSAITGAKVMVGTSGGGFDLMTETLSLTGVAGVPLVFYLAQRPGPGTGVATYQAQGDLNIALHSGHGEFPRVVLAPGDIKEAEELTTQAFYFSQRFQIPVILLSDKHLAESVYTMDWKSELVSSKKLTSFGRYNSYEKNIEGSATEDPEIVKRNIDARNKKKPYIEDAAKSFYSYKVFGKTDSENVVISYGSTKGAILDSIEDIDVKFVHVLYLEPFPKANIWKELIGKNIILVENSSTGQLGDLIKEKTGFNIPDKNKILRYDGRPFLKDELQKEIQRRLR